MLGIPRYVLLQLGYHLHNKNILKKDPEILRYFNKIYTPIYRWLAFFTFSSWLA